MKKNISYLILFCLLFISSFSKQEDYFISVELLKKKINNENLIILDARGKMRDYITGHIPGAILTSWVKFSDIEGKPSINKSWGTLKEKEALQTSIQSVGINSDSSVIIYSDTGDGFGEGARLVWMLKYLNFKDVHLLDGGINMWTHEGGDLEYSPNVPLKGDFEITRYNHSYNISTKELSSKLHKYSLLDTRNYLEYKGQENKGEIAKGKIPGAINIPYQDFFDANGLVKPKRQVDIILKKSGIDTSKPIVSYCNAGVRSTFAWITLMSYGYQSKNYDASFSGWSIENKPIIKNIK